MYENRNGEFNGQPVLVPKWTYMSVPCSIIQAGYKVQFWEPPLTVPGYLSGAYQLLGTKVWDSALRFTSEMYIPDTYMCCSFTGAFKTLNIGKGGCILTDNKEADAWFRKARFSGRNAISYHEDTFTMLGWNMYMSPVEASLGNLNFAKFYKFGVKVPFPDICLPYPDLSQHKIYTQ
jgi:hypothetical protein